MELFNARVGSDNDEEERAKLIFEEIIRLEEEIKRKTITSSRKSTVFWWINSSITLVVILSAFVIIIFTSIYNLQNVTTIVLSALIFAISTIKEIFKIGNQGYNYRTGTFRLRRIRQHTRDIMYMFHTYTTEQILAFISFLKTEIDEIDLDLYKTSMPGDTKFEHGIKMYENRSSTPVIPSLNNSQSESNSHIFIHIDSPSSSPQISPRESPILEKIERKKSSNVKIKEVIINDTSDSLE